MTTKPRIIALAVLGAFAAASSAADVSVHVVLDTGFSYQNWNLDDGNGSQSKLFMQDGGNAGSRFQFKGKEDLGNGYAVGFNLESRFEADTGAMNDAARIFGREATLSLYTPTGTWSFGRMCMLRGGKDTTGSMFKGNVSPFATGWGDSITGTGFVTADANKTISNAILYKSPKLAGWQFTAQYSLANKAEGTTADKDDRYMAAALAYKTKELLAQVIVDTTNLSQASDKTKDDPKSVSLAVNYQFPDFKLWGVLQGFWDSPLNKAKAGAIGEADTGVLGKINKGIYDGVGGLVAVTAPVCGGTGMLQLAYMNAEDATGGSLPDVDRYSVGLGWEYFFTKHTRVYSGLGYQVQDAGGLKPKTYEGMIGLIYKY